MTNGMKNTLFDLSGKIAIITGAAGLLGKQHARALLDAGATVVITDVSIHKVMPVAESLKASYGEARIVALEMDVTSHDDVSAVRSKLAQDGFSPSILINNAAIDAKVDAEISGLETSRLENFSMTQWQLEMDVGLKGALICSQVFGVEMASGGKGGVILNIASDLSVISPDQRLYRREGVPASEQPVKRIATFDATHCLPAVFSTARTLPLLTGYRTAYPWDEWRILTSITARYNFCAQTHPPT